MWNKIHLAILDEIEPFFLLTPEMDSFNIWSFFDGEEYAMYEMVVNLKDNSDWCIDNQWHKDWEIVQVYYDPDLGVVMTIDKIIGEGTDKYCQTYNIISDG